MDSRDIDLLCKNTKQLNPFYLGVFPSDKIPQREKIEDRKFCIVNLDPSYKDGSHWVALIWREKPKKDIYFDSYGMPPCKNLQKHLRKFKYNDVQLQHPLSTACGQWCIFFCCAFFSDHELKDISSHFSQESDLLANDYFVNKFVNLILVDDKSYKVLDRDFLEKQICRAMKINVV